MTNKDRVKVTFSTQMARELEQILREYSLNGCFACKERDKLKRLTPPIPKNLLLTPAEINLIEHVYNYRLTEYNTFGQNTLITILVIGGKR